MSQINVNTIANLSGTTAMTVDSNGFITPNRLEYRSVAWPTSSFSAAYQDMTTAYIDTDNGNSITYTLSAAAGGLGNIVDFDIDVGTLTNGLYEINAFMSHDRSSNASESQIWLHLIETTSGGGTVNVLQARDTTPTADYAAVSISGIRDYTSEVPTLVRFRYEANHGYSALTNAGCGFTIKRIT
jgi:hypothetical protein